MRVYDVIVIGAGPAGIAASAYAHRLGLDTLLIYSKFGGQLNYTHNLYSVISASDIYCTALIKLYFDLVHDIDKIECEISKIHKEEDVFVVEGSASTFYSRTVIVCTGRRPQIPEFDGYSGEIFSFLDFPYSTVTKTDKVLIVGGGYTGLDICEMIAKKVNSIVVVERSNRLGGNKERQMRARREQNVAFFFESVVQFSREIPAAASVFTKNKQCSTIEFSKLFACVGTKPNTEFLDKRLLSNDNAFSINMNHNEKQNENMSPFIAGLYAAGDVIDRPITGYATIAESSGLEAAIAVYNFLLNKGTLR